ncbi:MAG TPA: hypothetical protein DCS91_05095 [Microcoleaceae bacterium UBA11344]|nr:hypothetical protein [Microcoleaceae cyanobacterium UBA11344]
MTPGVTESAIEEMSEGNGGVEAIVEESVTLSVAIAQVESVVGEELPFVALSKQHSESDSVEVTSGGRLEEFNAIGKQIVGAFPPWLSSLGGSLLFDRLRKLVLEVRGEWCRWGGLRGDLCEYLALLLGMVFSISSLGLMGGLSSTPKIQKMYQGSVFRISKKKFLASY